MGEDVTNGLSKLYTEWYLEAVIGGGGGGGGQIRELIKQFRNKYNELHLLSTTSANRTTFCTVSSNKINVFLYFYSKKI